MMESDKRVVNGNISSNEKTTLHAETFVTKKTNARHLRLPYPPYEKWSNSFFKDCTKKKICGRLMLKHHLHLMKSLTCGITLF